MQSRLMLAVLFVGSYLGWATGAGATGDCLDQGHDTTATYSYVINSEIKVAQIFKARLGGVLANIDVLVDKVGAPSGNLVVELRTTDLGEPVAAPAWILASWTVLPEEVSGPTVIDLDASGAAVAIRPGDVLAIVVSSPDSGVDWQTDVFNILGDGLEEYDYGDALYYSDLGGTWGTTTDENGHTVDLGFHTYLDCATPTTPASWSEVRAMYR